VSTNAEFEQLLIGLREGYLTPEVFFAQSRIVWQRLARNLLRRWQAPAWYTHEEVEQELMLAAYHFVWKFDTARAKGRSIGSFVSWNAMDKAKKALHVARGAKLSGDADKNPSRIETPFSTYEVSPDEVDLSAATEAIQEEWFERQEAIAEAERLFETERERLAVRVLAENNGCIEDAALQLSCHGEFTGGLDASRFVTKVAERLMVEAA
jgi:uncharacterized protein (DUF1778 family)